MHCAVDCGSIGCSALRPGAFTAPQLSDKAGEQQKLLERALPVGSVDHDRSFNVVGR